MACRGSIYAYYVFIATVSFNYSKHSNHRNYCNNKEKNYIGLLGCTQCYQINIIDFSQAHLYHINLKYLEVFKKSVFSLKHKRISKFTQWLISVIFSKQSCLMIQASIQKSVFNIQWFFVCFFPIDWMLDVDQQKRGFF